MEKIEIILGESVVSSRPIGGGSIAESRKIVTASGKMFFLKTGFRGRMFACEANGLNEIRKSGAIRVPEVMAQGEDFLLLEYIEPGAKSGDFFQRLGRSFARMHRCISSSYGFYEDNFIGSTPQPNIPEKEEASDWISFYFRKRLLYQYRLAEKNRYLTKVLQEGFAHLEKNIRFLLQDSIEEPCLLHGDLWSGNYLCSAEGEPVLIDPAVYYGHREADLAMTRLFGGFSPSFYESYQEEYPLKKDWEVREPVFRLYHVMNHLNLFGVGYLGEAERLLKQLLV